MLYVCLLDLLFLYANIYAIITSILNHLKNLFRWAMTLPANVVLYALNHSTLTYYAYHLHTERPDARRRLIPGPIKFS